MRIILSDADHAVGIEMGKAWRRNAVEKGFCGRHGISQEKAEIVDMLGMLGEIAFRRLFGNLDFPNKAQFKAIPDALGCDIRTTSYEHGCLIIRDDDPEDRPYVLMIGRDKAFRCAGWRWGWERKHFHKRPSTNKRPPAWFIAQGALRNPSGLWSITGKEIGHAEALPE